MKKRMRVSQIVHSMPEKYQERVQNRVLAWVRTGRIKSYKGFQYEVDVTDYNRLTIHSAREAKANVRKYSLTALAGEFERNSVKLERLARVGGISPQAVRWFIDRGRLEVERVDNRGTWITKESAIKLVKEMRVFWQDRLDGYFVFDSEGGVNKVAV